MDGKGAGAERKSYSIGNTVLFEPARRTDIPSGLMSTPDERQGIDGSIIRSHFGSRNPSCQGNISTCSVRLPFSSTILFLGQVVPGGQPLYCIQGPRHDKPDKRASCLIVGLGLQRGIFTSQALNRGTKRPETAEQGGAGGRSGRIPLTGYFHFHAVGTAVIFSFFPPPVSFFPSHASSPSPWLPGEVFFFWRLLFPLPSCQSVGCGRLPWMYVVRVCVAHHSRRLGVQYI